MKTWLTLNEALEFGITKLRCASWEPNSRLELRLKRFSDEWDYDSPWGYYSCAASDAGLIISRPIYIPHLDPNERIWKEWKAISNNI